SAGLFGRGKFDDHDPTLGPVPFEDLHFAAADDEPAAVSFESGEDRLAVVLVTDGIEYFDADEDVGGHGLCGSFGRKQILTERGFRTPGKRGRTLKAFSGCSGESVMREARARANGRKNRNRLVRSE